MAGHLRHPRALLVIAICLCCDAAQGQLGGVPAPTARRGNTPSAPPTAVRAANSATVNRSAQPLGALPTQTPSSSPPITTIAPPSAAAEITSTPPAAAASEANPPLASISKATTTTPAAKPETVSPVTRSGEKVPTRLTSTGAIPSTAEKTVRNSVRVTKGSGTLPNDSGQVWREYDISPYTSRLQGVVQPEQAIVDWVLRETGTDAWFRQPLGILNADKNTLRVYHTPKMQQAVHEIVDRFFETAVTEQTLSVRVFTMNSPGWRSKAISMLKPIEVKSAGVDGWLLSREDAAVLLGDLRRRADFREQGSPLLQTVTGQEETISRTRPKAYPKTVRLRPDMWPGFETITGQIDEGFSLQISPLPTTDGKNMEVALKCNIDQVERFVPVAFDVPIAGQTQKAEVQVPQLVSWRLHERIRWPRDQVLLLSCGVVAAPGPEATRALSFIRPLDGSSRADALLLVEVKDGPAANYAAAPAAPASAPTHALPIQPLPLQRSTNTATRPAPTPWRF